MKVKSGIMLLALAGLTLSGCSGAFWGGTAGGAGATGAAYEINAHQQMERIDKDLREGKIDQREYDIRKDEIRRMSLFYNKR